MALIVDASALYAHADAGEPAHEAVAAVLDSERESLVTTELVAAEADYLILDRLGSEAELAFIDDLRDGAFLLECLDRAELETARAVVERYRDLAIGLADASLVVLAARYGTRRILTLDERHFRALRGLDRAPFVLLPADG